ncbi:MAG TPA: hypothetical protein VNT52_02625 [Acidimicrobiales bacterium]|nr:hypothetical protein [Acidimicrobiales bacterium]
MNKINEIIARSVSAVCGLSVFLNEEGRVACSGCKMPTDNCTNTSAKG